MRRVYRDGVVSAEAGLVPEPPDPFDQSRPQAFLDWLNAPAEGGPRRVSRFLYSIYLDRVDLQITYPNIHGADAVGFAEWVWQHGADVKGEEIPLELRPPPPGTAASPAAPPAALTEGVQIAGYFRAELGIGEAARLLTSAVEAAGIPCATTTYDATLNRQTHDFVDRAAPGSFDVNIVCVNADSTPQFAGDIGPDFFAGRHTAGYWFWEIEQFPETMYPAFDVVDEVWAATDFVAAAIRVANQKPVFTMPLPVPVPRQTPGLTRAAFGVPDRYTFLLLFDFLSIVERKNPFGLIEAFTRAFKPGEGPVLLLKTINGHLRLRELERLRAAAARHPDIVIIDGYFSSGQKDTLLGLSDCYVSLHRSEGLGLTMAEAMTLGKPVIATAYSGNLHFMRPDTSYLVDYTLTGVPAGCDPYPAGVPWADPNLDQAAGFMR
jgi:hypothetical protein